ncbi:MAG TPA: energy transducer TonB [Steroidobacter sp.]|jgi:TonB family protein|nr:energy transducer TonB [Steroidobacter sp.]
MANAQHPRSHGAHDEVNLEFDHGHSGEGAELHQPPVLVLSRDANLVETVRKAGPRGAAIAHAPDLDHVAEKLSNLKPGVLVVDAASTSDVASMVAQLTQHFPELVVVAAGKKEDSAALMQLTAAGRIFRFLLTPLSHGQTRLALEAAMTQHADLKAQGQRLGAAAGAEGGGKNYLVTYGALAAGLLVVVGGIWFGVSKFTGDSEQTEAVPAAATAGEEASGLPARPDPVQAELALAKEAFDQGKYLEPAGESALDLYRSALAMDPNSDAAKAGVRAVTDKVLERAEAALLAERLEEAIRNIETARDIDSTHPRLSFLDTQIARERERLKLTQAQEVSGRVQTLVSQANERMRNGRLISPSGSSARDSLVEARRLDPTNPAVADGIRELSGLLAEEARKALSVGKTDDAQTLVNAARQLGSAGAALSAVERTLADANRTTAAAAAARRVAASGPSIESMIADARQRMSAGKLIDPPGDSARDMLAKLRAAAPSRPEVEELSRALSQRLIDISKQATAAKAYDRAAQLLAGARDVGGAYNAAAISQAERELTAAREASAAQTIVSASALKRTRMVNPVYPESARKRGDQGWVELVFTVTTEGSVEAVEVRNASPTGVFEDAAVRAIRQWRFEPVERNGEKVAQRAMVRLKFAQGQ